MCHVCTTPGLPLEHNARLDATLPNGTSRVEHDQDQAPVIWFATLQLYVLYCACSTTGSSATVLAVKEVQFDIQPAGASTNVA